MPDISPSKIVKTDHTLPCGCSVTEYADDRLEIAPCVHHRPVVEKALKLDQAVDQIGTMTEALHNATAVLKGYARVIAAYKRMSEGCVVHPKYRATRPPPRGTHGSCTCAKVWRSKLYLDVQRKDFHAAVDAGSMYHPANPVPEDIESQAEQALHEIGADILDGKLIPFVTAKEV